MENENIKEFTQETETTEVVVKKTNLIEKWNGLKIWQKALVIVLLTGSLAGGVAVIYKLIKDKPEVVAEAIDAVSENSDAVVDSLEAQAV